MPEALPKVPEPEITQVSTSALELFQRCLHGHYVVISHDTSIISTQDKITALEQRAPKLDTLLLSSGFRLDWSQDRFLYTATKTNTAAIDFGGNRYPFLITTIGAQPLSEIEKKAASFFALHSLGLVEKYLLVTLGDELVCAWETPWISKNALKNTLRLGREAKVDLASLSMGEGFVGPIIPENVQIPNLIMQRHRTTEYTAQRQPHQIVDIAISRTQSMLVSMNRLMPSLDTFARENHNNLVFFNSPHDLERYKN